MVITGLRGVGKTVLFNRFERQAAELSWEGIDLEASKHDNSTFRSVLFTKLRAALLRSRLGHDGRIGSPRQLAH